jgi:hypothetical protein
MISPAITKALCTVPQYLSTDIHIHITGNSTTSPVSGSTLPNEGYENSTSTHHRDAEKVACPEPSDKKPLDLRTVMLNVGRPSIPDILKEELDAMCGGRMGVSGTYFCIVKSIDILRECDHELKVCGSDSMVNSTRSALGMSVSGPAAVMKGGASVSLFVEGFGYA